MPIYWVNLDVQFKVPMENADDKGGVLNGYRRDVGATFPDEEALKSALTELVYADEWMMPERVEIVFETIGIIAPKKVKKEIYGDKVVAESLRGDPLENGIWYLTGCGFYYD